MFDAVHGGQQLRLFNAHHDEYGFQPIVVFDGDGRFVTAMLRPAKRPKGAEIGRVPAPTEPCDPGQLAGHLDPDPGRQPLLLSRGDRLLPGERSGFHPRRCAGHDIAPPYRRAGSQHQIVLVCLFPLKRQADVRIVRCARRFVYALQPPFLAEAERSAAGREAAAFPPILPPL